MNVDCAEAVHAREPRAVETAPCYEKKAKGGREVWVGAGGLEQRRAHLPPHGMHLLPTGVALRALEGCGVVASRVARRGRGPAASRPALVHLRLRCASLKVNEDWHDHYGPQALLEAGVLGTSAVNVTGVDPLNSTNVPLPSPAMRSRRAASAAT